jgi:hypothetical protein
VVVVEVVVERMALVVAMAMVDNIVVDYDFYFVRSSYPLFLSFFFVYLLIKLVLIIMKKKFNNNTKNLFF